MNDTEKKNKQKSNTSTNAIQQTWQNKNKTTEQKKSQHKQQKQAKNKQIQQTNKQTKKKSKSERATFIQHELPNKCVGHSHFMLN